MAITLVERKTTKTLYVRKTIEIVKDYESRVRAEIRTYNQNLSLTGTIFALLQSLAVRASPIVAETC